MHFMMEQPVAHARKISRETGFGAAIEIIALSPSFSRHRTDADDKAILSGCIMIGDYVQDGDSPCIVDPDDPFAFFPVCFGKGLIAQVAEYTYRNVGLRIQTFKKGGMLVGTLQIGRASC